jgi:hypothetical protein
MNQSNFVKEMKINYSSFEIIDITMSFLRVNLFWVTQKFPQNDRQYAFKTFHICM